MFLKSLTIRGFKTFADSTVLEFEPGVTVVVGPNGSGKSNVVDAIAWVLGAQAPSAVRSDKMEDVIFHGTAKRAALGRAEVTLTLDNSEGLLPLDFQEVSIGRTLFRNGTSEYSINGVDCRLLDIQEMLSDAGVGRQQHVIIGQGRIDEVLSARPEQRRAIIEEAAGVLKYRRRKEKAERRLEGTEANLLRVQDLIREVRRQLRPLERQAEAARRHGQVVAELRALRMHLAGRELAALRARLTALTGDRTASQEAESALRAELAVLDTEVVGHESELSARGDSGVSDELVKVEQLRERARGLSALIAERRRSMERDQGQHMAEDVVAALESESARLRADLDDVTRSLATALPESESLAEEEATFARERAESETLFGTEPTSTSAASAAAEVRGELRTLRNAVESAAGEMRRHDAALAALAARRESADRELAGIRASVVEAETAVGEARARLDAAISERIVVEAAVLDAQEARVAAETSRALRQVRLEQARSAAATLRARSGAEQLAGVSGVVGALVDLLVIEDGWESAVKAALGEAVGTVVVLDADAGARALAALAGAGRTGAVLLANLAVNMPMLPAPAGGIALDDKVRPAPGAPQAAWSVARALLGRARCAATLTEAMSLAGANPGAIVVTRDGDRLSETGWRTGAADESGSAEAVHGAEEALAAAEAALAGAVAAAEEASEAVRTVRGRIDALDAELRARVGDLERLTEQASAADGELRGVIAERDALSRAAEEVRARVADHQRRVSESEAILPALEDAEVREQAAAAALGEARAALDSQAAHLAMRRRDLDIRIGGLRDRDQFLRARMEEVESRLSADADARAEAANRRQVLERSLRAVSALSGLVESHQRSLEVRLGDLQEIRRRQSDEVRDLAQRLDTARRRRSELERSLEAERERARRFEIEDAEVRIKVEASVEMIRRELEVEPEAAEAAEMPELPEGTTAPDRVRVLERDLRLMGPINPLALEEFEELQKRSEFLEEQLADVRNTRRELNQIIKAVDDEIKSVFAAAFEDVSTNFSALFSMLFPGGKGRLVLDRPDDILDTGIEVEASPPGKTVRKLSLLSGGERAMTAIAFLFAVFRSRPSPFYVMDEVEAALDDANLHRFLNLVHEFRREAQLIIVSHQKRTMEAGDSLLGVTMQPGGSSTVVTEKPSKALS